MYYYIVLSLTIIIIITALCYCKKSKENYDAMPDNLLEDNEHQAVRGDESDVSYNEKASNYNEAIKDDALKGTNIEMSHADFASSIKPITNQPSRAILRDDEQDPIPWIGLRRSNPFLNINRSLPSRDIPSQLMEDMRYSGTISIQRESDDLRSLLSMVPKEVY